MIVRNLDQKIADFIESLEMSARTKVTRMTTLLGRFGNQLPMPYSKKMGDNLFELRIRGQQEVRIFYTFYHDDAILLHGFIKNTQKTPQKEIGIANAKLKELTIL